jgi:hypothetical protein
MHDMSLNKLYDFIQVIYSMRKHYTRVEYFSKHILFSTFYLLQDQKLNPRNYFSAGNKYDFFNKLSNMT